MARTVSGIKDVCPQCGRHRSVAGKVQELFRYAIHSQKDGLLYWDIRSFCSLPCRHKFYGKPHWPFSYETYHKQQGKAS
jgi:hypothetical protein